MTVPSAHASRPTAGRRKPTEAKTGPPQRGFVLLLLPESTCECAVCLFLPSLADCVACKQGHPPATHGRKAVRAASLQCFFFFLRAHPLQGLQGAAKVAAPVGDQEKRHLGFPSLSSASVMKTESVYIGLARLCPPFWPFFDFSLRLVTWRLHLPE